MPIKPKFCRSLHYLIYSRMLKSKLILFCGPCQIETKDHALFMAKEIKNITKDLPVELYYKSSYDKANRTSISGKRGVGIDKGLEILSSVKSELNIPVLTDVHTPEEALKAGKVVDIIQTPAFLCRQTDLLIAAGQSGAGVNIKKGQFLHPLDMKFAAEKVVSTGNKKVFLCERGTSFGYRDLVFDPRSLVWMKSLGYPVIYDATHSVQVMGGAGGSSSGNREMIVPLARAAAAVGVDGIFIETHEEPQRAPSDGASMLPLSNLRKALEDIIKVWCE